MTEFRSVDPSTGVLVTERPDATPAEIEAGLALASRTFGIWSAIPLAERAILVRKLGAVLRGGREAHARLMAEEIGKPITQGLAEIDKCALGCDYAADHGEEWLAPEPVATEAARSYVRRDPVGPVLAIMPWNFPFWQLFRFGASALVAGNTIVLKHAPNAPRCAEAIVAAFDAAGFPQGTLVNLFANIAQIEPMIADRRIAAVTLTGSSRAGKAVAAIAGRHLKPSVLELGGSDPFVVLADADLDAAARIGAAARLQNNGQSCIAAKRFIVHAAVAEPFLSRFRSALAEARVGDPLDPATTVGPMARRDLRDALHGQVATSLRDGARCVLGGQVPETPGFWYPPTLIVDAEDGMPVWSDETFGPVAAVRVVADDEQAITVANTSRFALGAALFTADPGRAAALAERLRCGAVFVNTMVRSDPRLPFGGTGESGWGRELGREGMWSFTNAKSVWIA